MKAPYRTRGRAWMATPGNPPRQGYRGLSHIKGLFMSWYELLDVAKLARQLRDEDREQGPVACPHDGEPLRTGQNGQLYCPYDFWRPRP